MPERQFMDIKEWLKKNHIEIDEKKDNIKCVNMPDDWYEDEELETEDEEEWKKFI